jgi:hypothetical protein
VKDKDNVVQLTIAVSENPEFPNDPIEVNYFHARHICYTIPEAEDFVATLQRAIEVAKNMNK